MEREEGGDSGERGKGGTSGERGKGGTVEREVREGQWRER